MGKKESFKKLKIIPLKNGDFPLLKDSQMVFEYANESVSSFYKIYQIIRSGSGAGSTTHNEQDLLRAMLVFACSGLDAVATQLISDCLQGVIELDKQGNGAKQEFKKFIERRIKKSSTEIDIKNSSIDTGFIAQILISDQPKIELIKSLQKHLSDNSLQSQDQLLKVAGYFAITKNQILKDPEMTENAFKVRNDIIHQMDVNLKEKIQGRKNRKVRGAIDMIKYTINILNIGSNFINSVAEKIYVVSSRLL